MFPMCSRPGPTSCGLQSRTTRFAQLRHAWLITGLIALAVSLSLSVLVGCDEASTAQNGTSTQHTRVTDEDIVNGREGQYRVRLMDNHKQADCAYPGLEVLPDGTFIATTYGHWIEGEAPFIVSVRFKLKEIDAKFSAP